ncbi:MmyB family transcriptional regulator [Deinococcus cellulosilyticus]|uniref:HTH cro/C1-type domain-containing protein n=1 Tax=Deinococcus cellulosilyticus (strain DSM 18568 / NBRC 106333 / KACC 11606 / 5516J-15) TaxID=1223518 RepID=A0A511N1P7_DEIC1|nr:helix-turn-helix domain-containing protein [Deinococcus cellulosilyticus]GEM46378.1 hypothetical protein DC3_20130 [Deinococcus cellulosilyticus NBRC 106333 = KACC 11606]
MTLETSLGEYLQTLRQRYQKSLHGLEQATGYSRQYLRMLETHRRSNPSLRFIRALTSALPLTLEEQQTLLQLSGHARPEAHPEPLERTQVSVFLRDFVTLHPAPTLLHDALWQVQAVSPSMQSLLHLVGLISHPPLVEALYRLQHSGRIHDWEVWIRFMLSQFKHDSLPLRGTPAYQEQIQHLGQFSGFREMWAHLDPALDDASSMPIHYTLQGSVTVHLEVIRLKVVGEALWTVSFMPADEPTRQFLRTLG